MTFGFGLRAHTSTPMEQSQANRTSFSPDGSSQNILPFWFPTMRQPAAGAIDLSSGDEVVIPELNAVQVFRPDGSSYTLASQLSNTNIILSYQQVVLDDVDGDSLLETVIMGSAANLSEVPIGTAYVFVFAITDSN